MLVNIHRPLVVVTLVLAGLLPASTAQAQVWSLQQCLDTAMAHNVNIAISKNNQAISEERYNETRAAFQPRISVNAEYRYYTNLPYQLMPMSVFGGPEGQFKEAQFGVPHNVNANVQLAMPLYNPQLKGAVRTTQVASEISELQRQKTAEEVYFDIHNTYYNAQILHHQLDFVEHNLDNTDRLLATVRLLKEQLLAKRSDVDKLVLQQEQLTTKKQVLQSQYELVLNTLKFQMGIPLNTPLRISETIDHTSAKEYAEQPVIDIRLALSRTRLAESETETLRSSRLPTVSLFGTFGTTGFGYDQGPDNFLRFYPIGFAGIQVSYTLFNGMATRRRISQKDLERANFQLQAQLLQEQNALQTGNARRKLLTAEKTVEDTRSQVALARSVYDQSLLQQREGVAGLTDVLLADNALQEAQQTYLAAVIDLLRADLELKKFTGNILP